MGLVVGSPMRSIALGACGGFGVGLDRGLGKLD